VKIPNSLEKQPVVETVIEIRFDSSLPGDAILGVFHNVLNEKFSVWEKLPALQVPENVRSNDPNFLHSALYKLSNNKWIVNIGRKTVTLSPKEKYPGWNEFYSVAKDIFNKIESSNSVECITRVGLRYINFFESNNFFEKLTLKLNMPFTSDPVARNLIFYLKDNDFTSKILISDNAQLQKEEKRFHGSIIDIDTFVERKIEFGELDNFFDLSHSVLERHFFDLLTDEFSSELGASYD